MGLMAKHILQKKSNEPEDTAIETTENETEKKDNQKDLTEYHRASGWLQVTKYTSIELWIRGERRMGQKHIWKNNTENFSKLDQNYKPTDPKLL